jgi:hypothetical protein
MKTWTRGRQWQMGAAVVMCAVGNIASAVPISLTTASGTYHQDFNTLATNGTSSTLPTGWAILETGSNANTTYTAGTGSSTTGDTYSFGASGSSERALGGLRSGSLIPLFGVEFRNDTGSILQSLNVQFTGEQWRLGASGRADRLDFQYSLDAVSLTAGTWVNFDPLDFVAPITTGTAGLLNGNLAVNQQSLSGSISGLNILADATFWFRWTDFDATGSDDGLAIDDFSLSWTAVVTGGGSTSVPDAGSSLALFGLALGGLGWFGRRFVR